MTQNREVKALTIFKRLGAWLNGSEIRVVWVWILAPCFWLGAMGLTFVGLTDAMRIAVIVIITGAAIVAGVYEWIQKDKLWKGTIGVFLVTWMASVAVLYFANRFVPPPVLLRGPLVDADDPIPKLYCPIQDAGKSDLVMLVGNDTIIGKGQGPFTPVQVGSCSALRISRTSAGLFVDAFSYDSGNNLIFRIERNIFEGLDLFAGFLKEDRPDRSTLLITDEHDQVVIGVRYLRKNMVRLWGTFECGDTRPVKILDDAVLAGRVPLAGHECVSIKRDTAYGLLFRSRS